MTTQHFNTYWNLEIPWFEAPNEYRGGWSGVMFYDDPERGPVFIKKQQNYIKKTWRHPFAGVLTVAYEKMNIDRLNALNIPTLTVEYYEQTVENGFRKGILMTQSLQGYMPLDQYLATQPNQLKALARKVAQLLAQLHQYRLAHCAMYPKHIFVRPDDLDLRFIDLEKLRYKPFKCMATLHDLNKLNRHIEVLPIKLRLYTLKQYLKAMNQENRYRWYRAILIKKSRRS